MIFGLHKREGLWDSSPCGVQGRSPGRGSGDEPGRRYGELSPPEADDILRLKGIFLCKISQ